MTLAKLLLFILALLLYADAGWHVIRGTLNFLPAFFVFLSLSVLFSSRYFSAVIACLVVGFCYLFNAAKLTVWGVGASAEDLHFLKNTLYFWNLISAYANPFLISAGIIIGATAVVWIYKIGVDKTRDRVFFRQGPHCKLKVRTSLFLLGTAWILLIHQFSHADSFLYRLYEKNMAEGSDQHLDHALKGNGLFTFLIGSIPWYQVRIPEPTVGAQMILQKAAASSHRKLSSKPDILVWVNESTFNPESLTFHAPILRSYTMFRENAMTVCHGPLKIHTFGGGSWITEFEFLTGLPQAIFGPAGRCAPFTLSHRVKQTLATVLKNRGYKTICISPLSKGFMNAANAYAAYGFDVFLDPKDLGYPKPRSWKIEDSFFADHAMQLLKNHHDGPLFVMALTIKNHGPYDGAFHWNEFTDFQPALSKTTTHELNDYLFRLKETDRVIARLSRFMEDRSRPTLLLYFGDHLPSFTRNIDPAYFRPGIDLFTTTYHLQANYPVSKMESPAPLDIIFLGSLLLDVAGLNNSEFFHVSSFARDYAEGVFKPASPDDSVLLSFRDFLAAQIRR